MKVILKYALLKAGGPLVVEISMGRRARLVLEFELRDQETCVSKQQDGEIGRAGSIELPFCNFVDLNAWCSS